MQGRAGPVCEGRQDPADELAWTRSHRLTPSARFEDGAAPGERLPLEHAAHTTLAKCQCSYRHA